MTEDCSVFAASEPDFLMVLIVLSLHWLGRCPWPTVGAADWYRQRGSTGLKDEEKPG